MRPTSIVLSAVTLAIAALGITPTLEAQGAPKTLVISTAGVRYTTRGDLGAARSRQWRGRADLLVRSRLGARVSSTTSLSLDWTDYDFENFSANVPGVATPLNEAITGSVVQSLSLGFSPRWSIGTTGLVRASAERGAKVSDAFEYGGGASLRYASGPKFNIGIGALYLSQLEDDAIVVPDVQLSWRPSAKFSFDIRGTTAETRIAVAPRVSFLVGSGFEFTNTRLDQDGVLPSYVWRRQAIPVEAGFAVEPTRRMTLSITGGVMAWQELELTNATGTSIWKDAQDPSATVGFRAAYRF